MRKERVLLEHHAEIAAPCGHAVHVASADEDPAAIGLDQAGDRPERRRLAAPAGTEERKEFAVANLKRVDVEDDLAAEGLLQPFQPDDGHVSP